MRKAGARARRILVVSGDILPLPGLPTTGAGLRAWGLGKGLESRGHEVTYLMPRRAVTEQDVADKVILYDSDDLHEIITGLSPDVVVFQHWPTLGAVPELEVPVVVDLHGPVLLEAMYQDRPDFEDLKRLKVETLAKADFFTCAGELQRNYFYAWLLMSGVDLRDDVVAVIPVSLSPDLPPHRFAEETTFVYGGVYLPWVDPTLGLEVLIESLERNRKGTLKFFGGIHGFLALPIGKYKRLEERLKTSERVEVCGMIPHDRLVSEYTQAHAAFDIMARNPERELAFTTRTVEYLWCGLPVIYNNYAELASYIERYRAGWLVDPDNDGDIAQAVDDVLHCPDKVAEYGANAQRLVREQFTWDKTIEALHAFCSAPSKRVRPRSVFLEEPTPVARRQSLLVKAWQQYRLFGFRSLLAEVLSYLAWLLLGRPE